MNTTPTTAPRDPLTVPVAEATMEELSAQAAHHSKQLRKDALQRSREGKQAAQAYLDKLSAQASEHWLAAAYATYNRFLYEGYETIEEAGGYYTITHTTNQGVRMEEGSVLILHTTDSNVMLAAYSLIKPNDGRVNGYGVVEGDLHQMDGAQPLKLDTNREAMRHFSNQDNLREMARSINKVRLELGVERAIRQSEQNARAATRVAGDSLQPGFPFMS